jgi:dipeptidyl aminopeptidase/acylaminoacyl peptidase
MPVPPTSALRFCFAVLTLAAAIASAFGQALPVKKPLTHADYEIWTASSGFKLAPDGKTFAYSLTPPEGDGAIVVRTLGTGSEVRLATTGKPPTPDTPPATPSVPGAEAPATPTAGASGPILFSPDSKWLAFTQGPTKEILDKAKAEKTKPEALPKPTLALYDLATGKVVSRVEKLRSYAIVGEGAGYLLLHHEAKPADDSALAAVVGFALPAGKPAGGSDLIVRNFADGKDLTFPGVAGYSATKDGKQLLLTITGTVPEKSGLFATTLGKGAALTPIVSGPGKTANLTWNEEQTKLAFFHAEPATPPKNRVYLWQRDKAEPAVEIVPNVPAGLKAGYAIAERGGLSFSTDGLKLSVNVGPIPPEPKVEAKGEAAPAPRPSTAPTPRGPGPRGSAGPRPAAATPTAAEDKVELDLWHWKDEAIQPMQKIRSAQDRQKSYRAIYFLDTKQFKQVGTDDTDVTLPAYGDWAVATSDKAYRSQLWRSPIPKDVALLNVRTGEGKPLLTAHEGSVTSPYGNVVVAFNGKDWVSYAVPDGKSVNLTAKLGVKFFNEDFDTPTTPNAYGSEGFTADRKHVLVRDRYDIWKLALDGSSATKVTQIGREIKTTFRLVRIDEDDNLVKIDLGKPWLLSATNLETQDGGYYRLEPGAKPKLLTMAPRQFGPVTKAKLADTLVVTATTFSDPPDYYATTLGFQEFKKVTDLQPRQREFNWGKAELVNYKSADGVPLRGMLVKPENFDATKKYPMIVYIYERLSEGVHQFRLPSAGTSINPTFYASNGYLVFMPDIAYTTGAPGQSALKCVLPAIQAVADRGYVNENAIGIQGHSWGGYQIAYMVTQTNRFKAAAAGAPVTDMVSAYGGIRWGTGLPRQFQYEKTQSRIGATLWQAPLKYIENSPIFAADRVQTPLMLLHNDQDDAVPWYQGIEYYLALRRLDKEVYLFNYNGELHGLRKKVNQRDYTLRMQQFFDYHLKGAVKPEWMVKGIPYNERDKEKEQWKALFGPAKPPKVEGP